MFHFTNKLNYPFALYPNEIKYIDNITPNNYPVPHFNNKPLIIPNEANSGYIILGILFLTVGIANCNMGAKHNTNIGFALIIGAIILYLIYREADSTYNFNLKRYHEERKKKQIDKEKYINDVEFYNKFVAPYLHFENQTPLAKFKVNLFIEYFKKTELAQKKIINIKGVSEKKFYTFLNIYFQDSIKVDTGIETFDSEDKRGYLPDFIFIDNNSKLHIDIEIDEPYTIDEDGDKIVIHNLNNAAERKRDLYFISNKWIVLRFAEEQIVKYPEYCAFALAYLILEVLGDDIYVKRISKDYTINNETIKIFMNFKRWTYDEAEKMASENYRENYIRMN